MNDAIVYSLLLLALDSLADQQVHNDPTWNVPANIRELISLENSHDRNVRDTGTSKSSSSNNGTFSIESGVGPGICLNITRRSSLNFVYKAGCMNSTPMMGCSDRLVKSTKNEAFPVEHFVRVRTPFCCEGYTEVASRNSTSEEESSYISRSWPDGDIYCKPVCNPPCINGHCAAPNTCKCPKQMVLMEDNRTCEVPKCEPNCVNADCVGHNKCKCHSSYVKDPSEVNFCVPHCSVPCKSNSYCYFPNECRCMKGHRRNPISEKCEPNCQLNCVNGYCSTAKECTCFEGFTKVVRSNNKCEPECENCKNGVCTAPGVCKCNDLYKYNEKTKNCEAECPSDCTQGCDIPMQCKGCKEGYTRTEGSLDCHPQCKGCQNGVCTAPGVCKCNHLYKYNEKTKNCVAECPSDCTQGCDIPMQCKGCKEGYTRTEGSLDCHPQCKGCQNGMCTAPGVCKCNDLYKYNEKTKNCEAECPSDCTQGCDIPMQCKGCKEGYTRTEGSLVCRPQCKGCQNGMCTAPGVCKCNDLYKYNEKTKNCEAECPSDCTQGCDIPMQCKGCKEGYTRTEGSLVCRPQCKGCQNGMCTAPGVCKCNHLYEYNETTKNCTPKCLKGCTRGCDTPMTCRECDEGYKSKNGSLNCEPECKGCNNGVCIAPEVCKCNDLHKYNGTTNNCTPECPEDCSAGCDTPMQCNACGEGYKRKVGGPNCEPECKRCGNGECMAPGVCLCKEGYARDLDDTECVPKCNSGCRNGVCSAPNTCTCFKGYHLVNESVCESDTASCSKSVEDRIKLTDNDSCVDLHEPLQMYTDNCSSQFTNSSCFEELCSTPETETHPICSMHYMCEFVEVPSSTMLHSHSVQLQCRWRNRKMLHKNTTIEFESSANSTTAVRGSNANMQDDNLPLHFFRSDFHLKPCLLCLCPVKKTRSFCWNESYALRLCACGSEMAVMIEDSENDLYIDILYFICIPIIIVVLFALFIKYNNMKIEARTYVVSSFSNASYGICKLEEAEPVYFEIEEYEQPRNIMFEFNNL